MFYLARADADKMAHQAQVLWSACQALYRSIKAGCAGLDWKNQLRPLIPEIMAVQKAAGISFMPHKKKKPPRTQSKQNKFNLKVHFS